MNITKSNISKGIKKLSTLYIQFEDTINKFGIEEVIQTWEEVFNKIDYDYKEANEDFINAIYKITIESKYPPTIAEIILKMREIYINRKQKEELQEDINISKLQEQTKIIGCSNKEKTKQLYRQLLEKYSLEEIIKKLIDVQKENRQYSYNLTLALERILENE